jgi:hypothetical protein
MPNELNMDDVFVVIERRGLPGGPSGWGGFERVRYPSLLIGLPGRPHRIHFSTHVASETRHVMDVEIQRGGLPGGLSGWGGFGRDEIWSLFYMP